MALDPNKRSTNHGGSLQDTWPKWMWFAVPILVVIVVLGLWWAIFSPSATDTANKTVVPAAQLTKTQPTQGPTSQGTLPAATKAVVPLATFTPTPGGASTPEATSSSGAGSLTVGGKAVVATSGGAVLNVRAAAGTTQTVVKTLKQGVVVDVIGGPKTADGFTWWQIRDDSGTTGWASGDYLTAQ